MSSFWQLLGDTATANLSPTSYPLWGVPILNSCRHCTTVLSFAVRVNESCAMVTSRCFAHRCSTVRIETTVATVCSRVLIRAARTAIKPAPTIAKMRAAPKYPASRAPRKSLATLAPEVPRTFSWWQSAAYASWRQATPSFFCSFVLDVVYWNTTRSPGETMDLAAWAISAASWKPERMSFSLPG